MVLESARSLLEQTAAALDLRLRWLAIADALRLRGPIDERLERNLLAQFEAALRTVAVQATSYPLQLVFLLNQDGVPKRPEYLLHASAGMWLTRANIIAACEIQAEAPSAPVGDDAWVLWIDDPTVPVPLRNPYANPIKYFLYRRYPAVLDALRQRRTDRLNRRMLADISSRRQGDKSVLLPRPVQEGQEFDKQKTALFCMYWLDFGGAEAFALRTMAAAREAGYRVIVACDELGRHRVIEKAREIADSIYLIGNYNIGPGTDRTLLRILRLHRPDLIHIHHSFAMYRLLPALRALGSTARIVDSTHLLEHRDGDFPKLSVLNSELIDVHHVISRDLVAFYTQTASVPARRVRLGRLHDMSEAFAPASGKWDHLERIDVTFVGRFTQQKRPYLFVDIASRLVRRFGPRRFRFRAIGEGQLRAPVEAHAERLGVSDCIEFLPGNAPLHSILAETHVLVVCSDNEGLTLAAFEAIRAGCLVISCDVGGQRELVAEELLVPRYPFACIRQAAALIGKLAQGSLDPVHLLRRQEDKLQRVKADAAGVDVCLSFYQSSFMASSKPASAIREQDLADAPSS